MHPNVSLEAQLPFRVSATQIAYARLDGTPYTPDYVDIHHRNETLLGLGDSWVSARLRAQLLGAELVGRVGLTLPLGRTERNPFALGEQGLEHQHVQFGTGTVNPVLGFEATRQLGPVRGVLYGSAQLSLSENRHGYRAGTRGMAGAEAAMKVAGPLQLGLAIDLFHEEPERWDGAIQQDGNLGRTDLLLGLTAAYPLGDYVATASVKVPVYQRILGAHDPAGQLSYPAIVGLGVRRAFDLGR